MLDCIILNYSFNYTRTCVIGDVIGEKPGYLATLLIKISGAIEVARVVRTSLYAALNVLIHTLIRKLSSAKTSGKGVIY